MRKPLETCMVAIVLAGCVTGQRVSLYDDLAPASRITVEFSEPQTLRAVVDSTEYLVKDVRVVSGLVESVSPDTVVISVYELVTTGPVPHPFLPDRLAIPRDVPTRPSVRRLPEDVVIVAALVAGAGAAFLIYLLVKGTLDVFSPLRFNDDPRASRPCSAFRARHAPCRVRLEPIALDAGQPHEC